MGRGWAGPWVGRPVASTGRELELGDGRQRAGDVIEETGDGMVDGADDESGAGTAQTRFGPLQTGSAARQGEAEPIRTGLSEDDTMPVHK